MDVSLRDFSKVREGVSTKDSRIPLVFSKQAQGQVFVPDLDNHSREFSGKPMDLGPPLNSYGGSSGWGDHYDMMIIMI